MFIKKIMCLILSPITSLATFNDAGVVPVWNENIVETFNQIQNKVELELDSESAILMDEDSGTILYTKSV